VQLAKDAARARRREIQDRRAAVETTINWPDNNSVQVTELNSGNTRGNVCKGTAAGSVYVTGPPSYKTGGQMVESRVAPLEMDAADSRGRGWPALLDEVGQPVSASSAPILWPSAMREKVACKTELMENVGIEQCGRRANPCSVDAKPSQKIEPARLAPSQAFYTRDASVSRVCKSMGSKSMILTVRL
jgi:hypothetical protein